MDNEKMIAKARELTEYFFTNGAGQKATRLVLAQDDGPNSFRNLGGWSRAPIADKIREFASEVADEAVRETNSWTKWDWDDPTTWPTSDGEYLCNDGENSYVVDTWDSFHEEFIHYRIYGFWRPLPTVEHKEFAVELAQEPKK